MINELLYESWPWYIGGPLIGLTALAILFFERKSLGVSSSFEQVCAVALPAGEKRKSIWKDTWQIWFVGGMILGGAILNFGQFSVSEIDITAGTKETLSAQGLTDFSGYVPAELYSFDVPQLAVLVVGGFVIGFGARYAGGCTAGHSISGIAQLAPSSLLTTIGFFAGGLLSTYFVVPLILSL